MRIAFHILRKDVRHLWPVIAVALAVLAANMYLDNLHVQGVAVASPFTGLLQVLLPLSLLYLLVTPIQDDSLSDDRQFWLTRPYGWKSLLAAKALFVLAFVFLPFLAADAIRLAIRDLPVSAHLAGLLWGQAALSRIVLAVVALAAVTGGLAQFTFATLALVLATVAFPMFFGRDAGSSWGGLEWMQSLCQFAVLTLATVPVVLLQYARRRTVLARSLLAGGYALTVMAVILLPWDTAFALQSRLTGSRPEAETVRLAFDSGRGPLSRISERPNPQKVYLTIPIRLSGIPAGMHVAFDAGRLKLASPGAPPWDSRWRGDFRLSAQNDAQWAEIRLDRQIFERLKSQPVDLETSIAMTVFADHTRTLAPARPGPVDVPGGRCLIDGALPSLTCHFHRDAGRMLVHIEDPAAGASSPRYQILDSRSYGPSPGPVVIVPYRLTAKQYSGAFRGGLGSAGRFVFTSQRPAAHIIRNFTSRGVKLEDYRVKDL